MLDLSVTGLDRDLGEADKMTALARAIADAAGEDASSYSQITVHVDTVRAVDAVAAHPAWNRPAMWIAQGNLYLTRYSVKSAEVTVVYVRPLAERSAA
jgi:hypothetical protein